MDVAVRGLALGHLEGGDAQAPDVGHAVVANLLDHLGGHPEGRADHSVALGHRVLHRGLVDSPLRQTALVTGPQIPWRLFTREVCGRFSVFIHFSNIGALRRFVSNGR